MSGLLTPIHDALIDPIVKRYSRSSASDVSRRLAASLLAEYARRQPAILCELVVSSEKEFFLTFMQPLIGNREMAIAAMRKEIEADVPNENREARRLETLRKSRAAVALLRLEQSVHVWPLLRASSDPSVRSEIIHSLRDGGVKISMLVEQYRIEQDISTRRALLLAIGNYDRNTFPEAEYESFIEDVRSDFWLRTDPGLHAACEWLLRKWGVDVPTLSANDSNLQQAIEGKRDWFANSQGQSFAVLHGPMEFMMGSPEDEPDREPLEFFWQLTIDRTFAIGMKEVTSEEFKRFEPTGGAPMSIEWGSDYPACRMSYYQAAQYCRWLSEQEGIPEDQMCYPPIPQIKEGFKPYPNYLRRTGYRLPSEAEMEFYMRAGASTRFCFGDWEELFGEYGWYVKNAYDKARPTGLLKPNDFGLFDVHGNVREWGQEWISHAGGDETMKTMQRKYSFDIEDMTPIVNIGHYRIMRSGGFRDYSFNARCARRDKQPPFAQLVDVGIRLRVRHPVDKPE